MIELANRQINNKPDWYYERAKKLGYAIIKEAGSDFCRAWQLGDIIEVKRLEKFIVSEFTAIITGYEQDPISLIEKLKAKCEEHYGNIYDLSQKKQSEEAKRKLFNEKCKNYRQYRYIITIDDKYVRNIAKGKIIYNSVIIYFTYRKKEELVEKMNKLNIKYNVKSIRKNKIK